MTSSSTVEFFERAMPMFNLSSIVPSKHALFFLTVFGLMLFPTRASHAQQCRKIYDPRYPGLQQCTVSLDINTVEASPDSQRLTLWCWTASMSMIYSSLGDPISQESIVTQVYGAPANYSSGSLASFNKNLNRSYRDDDGNIFTAHASAIRTPEEAIAALSSGKPILYTTNHHATVQTALTYQVMPGGPIVPKGGKMWDPEPNVGWRPISANDMATYLAAWAITVSASSSNRAQESENSRSGQDSSGKLDSSAMFCQTVRALIADSFNQYKSTITSSVAGNGKGVSTSLPNAKECHIVDIGRGRLNYICSYDPAQHHFLVREFTACLDNKNGYQKGNDDQYGTGRADSPEIEITNDEHGLDVVFSELDY